MARNEEKAQSMLNRWLAYKRNEENPRRDRSERGDGLEQLATGRFKGKFVRNRPFHTHDCDNLPDAEKWRMEVIKEVGRKIMEIQSAALGEQRIRDTNDEINKLMREKHHWERKILELGGPNYKKVERMTDAELAISDNGAAVQGKSGYTYRYFGAAKELPDVKSMFEKKKEAASNKRQRFNDMRGIDADYYGYRDDEDGLLEKIESEAEKKAQAKLLANWGKEGNVADTTDITVAPPN
eukprot:TRINITY_DN4798_c0_g1_i1.p1 TRINITY_DN4798_c0_g1~~TRINITY_DN4798_c0_g1_i1.p1  ORF type:complete len:252 (+),score=45.60 TRINITY_DN4798_c0_g1_i1:41-757(+)